MHRMRNPNSQAGSGLGHPFFWAALALLLLNDHILKGAHVLPGVHTAFVAQRHPLGRISFVDLATDAVRTVTGFDLNSHVVN